LRVVHIPERIAEEIERRGLSVVDLLAFSLGLDPGIAAEARVELAGKYLAEAEEHLARGDAV